MQSPLSRLQAEAIASYKNRTGKDLSHMSEKALKAFANILVDQNLMCSGKNPSEVTPRRLKEINAQPISETVHKFNYVEKLAEANNILPKVNKKPKETSPSDVNYCDPKDFNRTLAHKAVIDNDHHRLEQLIEKGANLFVTDAQGFTPWSLAIDLGHSPLVFLLQNAMQGKQRTAITKVG